jgi:hypothetical protein
MQYQVHKHINDFMVKNSEQTFTKGTANKHMKYANLSLIMKCKLKPQENATT